MKTLLKKSLPTVFFSMVILLGMSCATLPDRHPDSSNNIEDSRWADPINNQSFERIQAR